jgi:predicted  nucleic acid-binding Zn-ribbon protein
MLEDVKQLIVLQDLDRQMLAIRDELKLYQPQLEHLKHTVQEKKAQIESLSQSGAGSLKERRRLEAEIADKEAVVQKYQRQQMEVKSNREYQALTVEIGNVRTQIEALEDQVLTLLTREDEQKHLLEQCKEELNRIEAETGRERQRIETIIAEKKTHLDRLRKERKMRIAEINPDVREMYNRLVTRYPGSVVVHVVNGSCGGCYMQLLPQLLVEVHQGKEIKRCSRCMRILISEEIK